MTLPKRKQLRLPDYDYSQEGWYFVTIDTYHKAPLFGSLVTEYQKHLNKTRPTPVEDLMRLNEAGKMIDKWWAKIPEKFQGVSFDIYRIMPHHVHGIICINDRMSEGDIVPCVGADPCVRPLTTDDEAGRHTGRPLRDSQTLFQIMRWFKTMTTNEYIENVKTKNWPRFNRFFWQRGYFEHIIRNEKSLAKLQWYIHYNPEGSITEEKSLKALNTPLDNTTR